MISRYKYLYENAYFILAPFMYERREEESKEKIREPLLTNLYICLNIPILDDINRLFEEFLLSEQSFKDTTLFQMIESKKMTKFI